MGIRSWSISTCEQETAIASPCARAENAVPPNKGMQLTRPVQVAASQLIPSVSCSKETVRTIYSSSKCR